MNLQKEQTILHELETPSLAISIQEFLAQSSIEITLLHEWTAEQKISEVSAPRHLSKAGTWD